MKKTSPVALEPMDELLSMEEPSSSYYPFGFLNEDDSFCSSFDDLFSIPLEHACTNNNDRLIWHEPDLNSLLVYNDSAEFMANANAGVSSLLYNLHGHAAISAPTMLPDSSERSFLQVGPGIFIARSTSLFPEMSLEKKGPKGTILALQPQTSDEEYKTPYPNLPLELGFHHFT